jgi:ribonuclease-3
VQDVDSGRVGGGAEAGVGVEVEAEAERSSEAVEAALGVRFSETPLLELALTHTSYAVEQERPPDVGVQATNQRLEFLGDAVLALVVADLAYRSFPELPEGELARLRSATVNQTVLAEVARDLGIGEHLKLGRGETQSGGKDKENIVADAMEAILGAVYLDQGLEVVFRLIERLFWPWMRAYVRGGGARDYKGMLQELTASQGRGVPRYVVQGSGPPHRPEFVARAIVEGVELGSGEGRTKKEAEQRAARQAHDRLLGRSDGVAAEVGEGAS